MAGFIRNLVAPTASALGDVILGGRKDRDDAVAKVLAQKQQQRQSMLDSLTQQKTDADIMHTLAQIEKMGAPAPPAKRSPRSFTLNGKPIEGFADESGKFYDAAGNAVAGDIAPYERPLSDGTPSGTVLPGAEGMPPQLVVTRPGDGFKLGQTVAVPDVSRPVGGGGGGGLAGAALRKAIADNRTQMKSIDAAIAELDANPDAVGLRRGLGVLPGMSKLGEIVNQKMDPEGVSARNALQNVGSIVILDRSGTAVSGKEWERLGFVPDQAYDYKANRQKLLDLKKFAETKTAEMEAALAGSSGAPGSASTSTGRMSYEEWKKAQGLP